MLLTCDRHVTCTRRVSVANTGFLPSVMLHVKEHVVYMGESFFRVADTYFHYILHPCDKRCFPVQEEHVRSGQPVGIDVTTGEEAPVRCRRPCMW